MASSTVEPRATNVVVTDDELTIHLHDGHCVSVPLVWYPRLVHATPGEQSNWELQRGRPAHSPAGL